MGGFVVFVASGVFVAHIASTRKPPIDPTIEDSLMLLANTDMGIVKDGANHPE